MNDIWTRNCPKCNKELTYTTKGNRNWAEKQKKICTSCSKKKIDIPINSNGLRIRNCPKCNKEIEYTNYRAWLNAYHGNHTCLSCRDFSNRIIPGSSRMGIGLNRVEFKCPICEKIVLFCPSDIKNRTYCSKECQGKALQKPDKHFTCVQCEQFFSMTHSKWKKFYKKRLVKFCSLKCLNESHIGSKRSSETKKKIRLKNIQRLQNQFPLIPRCNPVACSIFDEINTELSWNGIHGGTGNEFYIKELGYWVDYYEPNLNIVIEFDEKHHFKPTQQKKDLCRQNEIINHLNCKFYRIPYNKNWRDIIT